MLTNTFTLCGRRGFPQEGSTNHENTSFFKPEQLIKNVINTLPQAPFPPKDYEQIMNNMRISLKL